MLDVPAMNFLMIDVEGDSNTSKAFEDATEALFSLSYALKFMIKKSDLEIDYGVMLLEDLSWADDMETFSVKDKAGWRWTLMIMQPDFITEDMVEQATQQVRTKKKPALLPLGRFETLEEGKATQIMHIGLFSEEGPTVEKVHPFIEENVYQRRDKHHEIYLSDIRKAAPERWKPIIRQPVAQ